MSAAVIEDLTAAELATLFGRVRQGDTGSLGELYRQCRPAVVRYLAQRMDHSPGDVEDVAQETFLRVVDEARAFGGTPRDVRGWLCGWVAQHTLGDYRRHDRWRQHSAVDAAVDVLRRGPVESAAERESRPLSPRVLSALAQLPPAQRRSMQLRFLDGLSAEAAAEVAGSRPKAIVQNCVLARKRLRAELADLAPQRTSWLEGVSKAEAVRAAFEVVGTADVSAVMGWLRERGVSVPDSYVYAVRNGTRGQAADRPARRAPQFEGLSKADTIRVAFAAVSPSDVPAVVGWLRERGVTVTAGYVYSVRTSQPAPAAEQLAGNPAAGERAAGPRVMPRPRSSAEAGDRAAPDHQPVREQDLAHEAVARARQAVERLREARPVIRSVEVAERTEQLNRWHAEDQALGADSDTSGDTRVAELEGGA